jgi:hypothetical protein
MSRNSQDFDTKNLLFMLDRGKEIITEKKASGIAESLSKEDKILGFYQKNPSLSIDDQDLSLSLNGSEDHTNLYLLQQVQDIKKLLKNQEEMLEKYHEEENGNYKLGKDMKELISKFEIENPSAESYKMQSFSPEIEECEESFLASTLMGFNSISDIQSVSKLAETPFLVFLKKCSHLKFTEKVLIRSHLYFLNL